MAHTCDNPPCCNPRHLVAETQRDNTNEAIERGLRTYDSPRYRATRDGWWRHGRNGAGESNANAKLTDGDIAAIRQAIADGARQVDIADRFGVGQTTISRVARGKRSLTPDRKEES